MTGQFVYNALIRELDDWRTNCDTRKFNLIFDYIDVIAFEIGVNEDSSPSEIIDNLIVNGDYTYEGEDRYNELLKSGEYTFKNGDYYGEGEGIILV